MKKTLSILCTIAMMVTLFSVASVPMVSAAVDTGRWIIGGEGNVTANADGTLNVAQSSSAVLNEYINTNDPNLDVSVKFTAPYTNTSQHVMVYLTKDPANAYDGVGAVTPRFSMDGVKYGLSHAWFNGSGFTSYCGGYIPLSNGSVTIRIKNDNGLVRLYMDNTIIYYDANDAATTFSNAVKGLGGAYLGVAVKSDDGAISATILEVNGKNPTAEKTYAATDWIVGGEGNVTVNNDGTANIPQGSSVVLNEYINTNDPNLDVSVKFTAPYTNASQHVMVYLTQDPANAYDGVGAVTPRFSMDGAKYGLSHAWFNGSGFTSYCGGYIPLSNGSVTIRIKNDNGLIRLYMDNTIIYYDANDAATTFSNAVKGLGGAYLGLAVKSDDGAISATLLEVNGKNPTGKTSTNTDSIFTYGTAGILDTLVDGKQGLRFNYTLTTTAVGEGETVTVNGSTYTVSKIGMLVSKKADASMTVGASGVAQGYVTKARSIETQGEQITYTFSILVKNINKDNKATDIYARPYLECQDGTILYGKTQVTNVLEMYTSLSETKDFDTTVDDWMK